MDRIRATAILRLILFALGMVAISLVIIRASSQPILESKVQAATSSVNSAAAFTWSMPERFGPTRADEMVDFHWDQTTRLYDRDYVNPNGWKVNFNACPQGTSASGEYAWQINGINVPNLNSKSCEFSHEFAKQGTYNVKLIRTVDGIQTSVEAPVTVKDLLIVSLGDSFASGQGNPDKNKSDDAPAKWIDSICFRSEKSGPAQAALQIEKDDPHTSVTFLSFACSGAEIDAGILHDQTAIVKSQIDELKKALRGRPIDALTISIGGNDIGFSNLVARCILHRSCNSHGATLQRFVTGLAGLDARYAALNNALATLPSIGKIFITEYPDLVRDENGNPCDKKPKDELLLRKIDAEESEWASTTVIASLNRKVKEAADRHGWIYVTGISQKFRTHGYCSEDPWVRTFKEAKRVQGKDGHCGLNSVTSLPGIIQCLISSGAVHPAEDGHKQGYAPSLINALRTEGVASPATGPTESSRN